MTTINSFRPQIQVSHKLRVHSLCSLALIVSYGFNIIMKYNNDFHKNQPQEIQLPMFFFLMDWSKRHSKLLFLHLILVKDHSLDISNNKWNNRVFPPLTLSIFCRFYGIPFTTHMKKNITHVVQ